MKKAKREQRKAKPPTASESLSTPTISERSKERRKNIEDRKDLKKTSAFQDLKAKREEKIKKGMQALLFCMWSEVTISSNITSIERASLGWILWCFTFFFLNLLSDQIRGEWSYTFTREDESSLEKNWKKNDCQNCCLSEEIKQQQQQQQQKKLKASDIYSDDDEDEEGDNDSEEERKSVKEESKKSEEKEDESDAESEASRRSSSGSDDEDEDRLVTSVSE